MQGLRVQRRLSTELNVHRIEWEGGQVGIVGDTAGGAQTLEQLEDVGTSVANDPVSVPESA